MQNRFASLVLFGLCCLASKARSADWQILSWNEPDMPVFAMGPGAKFADGQVLLRVDDARFDETNFVFTSYGPTAGNKASTYFIEYLSPYPVVSPHVDLTNMTANFTALFHVNFWEGGPSSILVQGSNGDVPITRNQDGSYSASWMHPHIDGAHGYPDVPVTITFAQITSAVPEPTAGLMMLGGLALLPWRRLRKLKPLS